MHISARLNRVRRGPLNFQFQIVPIADRGKIGEPGERQSPVDFKGHMVVESWVDIDQKLPTSAFDELCIKNAKVAGCLKQFSQTAIDLRINLRMFEDDPWSRATWKLK